MSIKGKVFYNTAAQLVGKAATTVTTLILTVLITRRFGPSGYGDFTVMMAYSALFYIVADFGLNAIALRDFATDEKKISRYFKNLVGLRLVMALGLFLIAAVALIFFPYSRLVKIGVLISLLTIFTQALYTTANAVFQSKLRYDLSVLAAILGSVTILSLSFLAVGSLAPRSFSEWGLLPIVSSYVVGGLVMVGTALFFVRWLIGVIGIAKDFNLWRYLFLAALPLGITTIFSVVLQKADSLLLSVLSGNEAVGLYGASYKIFEFVLVFPTFFVNSTYPIMVRHFKDSREKLLKTVKLSGIFLLAVSVLGAVVGYLLAPWMIGIVAGPEFVESVRALRLLLLGLPVFYLSALFLWLLITLGKQRQIPFVYAIGAVVNVVLNLIFIPRYSFHASAVITWTSEFLILALLIYLSRRALE